MSSTLIIYAFFAFAFGAVVGSFLNVCICRLPKRESVVFPPSHCTTCDYAIQWYDNIPILSYLLLKGRCRRCGERISVQYPAVELINGLLALFLFLRFGPFSSYASLTDPYGSLFRWAILFVFCCALVVITFIDLEHQIIPDVITLPGIVVGFVLSFFTPVGWLNSLIGIVAGGGTLLLVAYVYELITKKEGMGGGDIKLLAMMGAFFGWQSVLFIIFSASLIGSVIGISVMVAQKKDSTLAIPFGPFLATGAIIYIFYGKRIILWYLTMGR